MKKFWKKVIPDFKFWIHLVNYNNSIRKTKSGPGVILEKKLGLARKVIGWEK